MRGAISDNTLAASEHSKQLSSGVLIMCSGVTEVICQCKIKQFPHSVDRFNYTANKVVMRVFQLVLSRSTQSLYPLQHRMAQTHSNTLFGKEAIPSKYSTVHKSSQEQFPDFFFALFSWIQAGNEDMTMVSFIGSIGMISFRGTLQRQRNQGS